MFDKYAKINWTINIGFLGLFIIFKLELFTGMIGMLYLLEHKPEYNGNVLIVLNSLLTTMQIELFLILNHFFIPIFFNLIVFLKKRFDKKL